MRLTMWTRLGSETIQDKYQGNLKKHYDDPAYEVVSLLFRVMTEKKVVTPGSFQSYGLLSFLPHQVSEADAEAFRADNRHDGQAAVKCNLKANEGQLYFLERQLLFISKQPTLVSFNEISAIVLARCVFFSRAHTVLGAGGTLTGGARPLPS